MRKRLDVWCLDSYAELFLIGTDEIVNEEACLTLWFEQM